MTDTTPPYVEFLDYIQAILAQGQFTSTYKFALLLSICDICVENSGQASRGHIDLADLSDRFAEYYWRQSRAYPDVGVLQQNNNGQAQVVTKIAEAAVDYGFKLQEARRSADWSSLHASLRAVIRNQPLGKLQTIGGQIRPFLYEISDDGTGIDLFPGIAECFERFHHLVHAMVRGAWVEKVLKLNSGNGRLSERQNLYNFLFGAERSNLTELRPALRSLQSGKCLYCGSVIARGGDVDHFVPWRMYDADLAPNLVLAHPGCNNAKRDHLAQTDHLAALLDRNESADAYFEEARSRGFAAELSPAMGVVRWAYELTEKQGLEVWMRGSEMQPLDPRWRVLRGISS